jgi:transcriptional regulator GlxA family with amidase domain
MTIPQSEPRRVRDGAQNTNNRDPLNPEQQYSNRIDNLPALDRRVRRVITLFEQDLARRWTLDELAAQFAITPRHLEWLFSRQTGFTPLQLLKALRLERACAELACTFKSVRRIAEEVGYRPESHHFERDFKAKYGLSPKAYRGRFGRDPGAAE